MTEEPTDAELDELRQANSGRLNFVTFSEFRTIARAALSKWGAQPVVRKPLTDEQIESLLWKYGYDPDDEHMAAMLKEACGLPLHNGPASSVGETEVQEPLR